MCPNCGFDNTAIQNRGKQTIVLHNCSRCGHKLTSPVSLPGLNLESEDNPVRERKTLLD